MEYPELQAKQVILYTLKVVYETKMTSEKPVAK